MKFGSKEFLPRCSVLPHHRMHMSWSGRRINVEQPLKRVKFNLLLPSLIWVL